MTPKLHILEKSWWWSQNAFYHFFIFNHSFALRSATTPYLEFFQTKRKQSPNNKDKQAQCFSLMVCLAQMKIDHLQVNRGKGGGGARFLTICLENQFIFFSFCRFLQDIW